VNNKRILTEKTKTREDGSLKRARVILKVPPCAKNEILNRFAWQIHPSSLGAKEKKDVKMKEEVGKRLKECRLASKMTQRQVAQRLGVAQPVYQRYEAGIYECSYEQIASLCALFDISADYLLGIKDF
jgi:DNA-binding XRE family transcriptional regulator